MAAFIVCVLVIMFVFGVIFVTDGFGQPIKETVDRFQRWNKWRKHSMNSRLYKFLVLIGLQYSPTLVFWGKPDMSKKSNVKEEFK